MKPTVAPSLQYEKDRAVTRRNRAKLSRNSNLLYWYGQLYRDQFKDYPKPGQMRILEIGSGVSPLKRFQPNVLTSDVLEFDYLDYVFDCHSIDEVESIPDESLDIITLTNVLHHLQDPICFLNRAASKLKAGGQVIATEPYFSNLSSFIFRRIHHEPVDLDIKEPVLAEVLGPLASANIALPWLIFSKHPEWSARLRERFEFREEGFRPFSSLSYMMTGGISHRLPVPGPIFRIAFQIDRWLSDIFPKQLASFFTIRLLRK